MTFGQDNTNIPIMILRHEHRKVSGALIKEYKTEQDIDPELINVLSTLSSGNFFAKNRVLEDIKSLLRRKRVLCLVSVGFNQKQVWDMKYVKESLAN